MRAPIQFHTTWRKSSYSAEDSNCVEVAHGTWRKSSFSAADSNCVEVALAERVVGIRDSKNAAGPHLAVPPAGWSALVHAVR
jgi:uncharacterized protein DUF397